MSFIVAIDGPAGTGKGTMATILSKKYNLVNIDTGATYRCVTLAMLNKDVSLDDEDGIADILKNIEKGKINYQKYNNPKDSLKIELLKDSQYNILLYSPTWTLKIKAEYYKKRTNYI